jgi:hypothetical protein
LDVKQILLWTLDNMIVSLSIIDQSSKHILLKLK